MKNKVFDYYKELPAWAKGVVIVGGIAIVYFTTKQFIGRIKKQGQLKKANEVINEQKEEKKKLEETGMRASYSPSQYKAWADGIVNQFDGCDFSPENYLIPSMFASYSGVYVYKIFEKLNNDVDFLSLQTAYGIRKYDNCGLWNGDFEGSLTASLTDELTTSELKQINNLLIKKGIKYRV